MQTNLELRFRYRSPGHIWHLVSMPMGEGWVVEERLLDQRVQYSLLDETGAPQWRVQPWPERWWTQLAGVAGDCVLVREYKDDQSPEHQQLHALSVAHGKAEWAVDNFSLSATSDTAIYGYLSTENGNKMACVISQSGKVEEVKEWPLSDAENIKREVPFLYREEEPEFATVAAYIKLQNPEAVVVGGAEYREWDEGIGVSWYAKQPNGLLSNWLWWLSSGGDRQLSVKLAHDLKGIGQTTFWVQDKHLFYIQDKQELVGYAL